MLCQRYIKVGNLLNFSSRKIFQARDQKMSTLTVNKD